MTSTRQPCNNQYMTTKATLTISLSTNPSVAGRYFADLRIHGRQTTRTNDASEIKAFVRQVRESAKINDVDVAVIDTTRELSL